MLCIYAKHEAVPLHEKSCFSPRMSVPVLRESKRPVAVLRGRDSPPSPRPLLSPPRKRRKTKRTAKNDRAQHSHLGFGNGKTCRLRRITYLTYPAAYRAGITVTFSRGFSPHSAARLPKDRRAVRCFHLSIGSIAHKNPNCKGLPAPAPRFSNAYPVRNGWPMRMVVSSVGCSASTGFCASA